MVELSTAKMTLSIADFCRVAGIGRSRAYEEIRAGRLKVLKCGRRTLIANDAVADWLKALAFLQEQQARS